MGARLADDGEGNGSKARTVGDAPGCAFDEITMSVCTGARDDDFDLGGANFVTSVMGITGCGN